MGHLVASDDQTDSITIECVPLGQADPMADREQVRRKFRRAIDPMIDFLDRHDKGMTDGHWVDRHECNAQVVAMDEGPRDLAGDDSAEDGGHVANLVVGVAMARL